MTQTASGLPKKSLEERKVSSEGGRSKASGGKKEGPEAAASSGEAGLQGTRGAEEGKRRWWRGWTASGRWREKVFKRVFERVFKREPDARFTRITFFDHVFQSRFSITFFDHVFSESAI